MSPDGSDLHDAHRNLQLITAADLNRMLQEKGCPKEATVQKICRVTRDEAQVRETLDNFGEKPKEATEALGRLTMHEAHRPSYPEWSIKPELDHPELVWAQLKAAGQEH